MPAALPATIKAVILVLLLAIDKSPHGIKHNHDLSHSGCFSLENLSYLSSGTGIDNLVAVIKVNNSRSTSVLCLRQFK